MRNRLAIAVSTSVLFLLVGCTPFNPFAGIGTREEVDRQAETWVEANVSDYGLTVALRCFCSGLKYAVEVRDGAPTEVTTLEGPDPGVWARRYRPQTVEELHALIRRFSDQADAVDVTYNDVGVPTSISIDRDVNSIDDELGYDVRFEET